MGEDMSLEEFGRTASVITIGDEVVEGRVTNENAVWTCGQLMQRGIWPRMVLAVPDEVELIARLLRVAWDTTDIVIVSGGMGFTPDDLTRRAVARASLRELEVNESLAASILETCPWLTPELAQAVSVFPIGAQPLLSSCGGVPGFSLGDMYVLPGSPREMRSMFSELPLNDASDGISVLTLMCTATEDLIHPALVEFETLHRSVRLGSYPDYEQEVPRVGLVLAARSTADLNRAHAWLGVRLTTFVITDDVPLG
jgi:molybdenum cofactor synthesis domain-containing protein